MRDHMTKQFDHRDAGSGRGQQATGSQGNQRSDAGSGDMSGTNKMTDNQWNELRSQVMQRWSQLNEDDLRQVRGDFEKLCRLIEQRTGESRQTVERELQQIIDREPESEGSASMGNRSGSSGR
jgi:hypothetical protein